MLEALIKFSIKNKLIVILFTLSVVIFGLFSISQIPIGAVPDVTNNQVQVITTSRNLSTQDIEQFITYPVELEMANLPGVKEIRSVSKFGLSVVTIVFDDNLGTYLPRQLIAEKIQSAQEKIPQGFGTPTMGPITTGLGEIYQYILDTKPGYDSVYSVMELRSIQDWIVKRQLSGIPGVVEVNTWGGYLKEYEVAINPERLRAMNTTVIEVFNALEKNNAVVGGGYIEKGNQSYFIRGEGLAKSFEDIGNIIVKTREGIPVLVRDVAQVQLGSATRFGAITGNGEGEKVLGQVMMLKDGNSKKVIEAVKARVAEVEKTLPEGVFINAFLERSELIGKTTFTVTENLILGFLIVLFIVILLLGNLRSGLLIASVIPLALLFTLSLMYIFGVDANLMSLGAIDFGIIIDGAVIIVEFIAFRIALQWKDIGHLEEHKRREELDKITLSSASKMVNSAIFGQLIILIVFIPILSLTGVEGKMFRPMAMTFSFALIGAMIFGFTYVPVVSSLFLKPPKSSNNISHRLMNWLRGLYLPSIEYAMLHKKVILGASVILLGISVYTFSRMGGEFVPTLDEGDFVIQPVLKTGTSLSKTIQITTRIEQILLDQFPEVDQVVSRIGAAEVPTDPMAMEESDIIIKLKPKSEWVSAKSKDELADKFKEALSVIPGVDYEFTQPIEMRFNELITGVRADLAIKIFGEDLGILAQKADEIKTLVENVDGASDITIEKVEGLPQMSIHYDRGQMAKYGVSVQELNQVVSLAFAGVSAGYIFEGEKRYDLVIRLHEDFRKNISNIQKLYITIPNGNLIPLSEVADIKYSTGPAKISRDDTKRRIVVGINVRNRDLESVVKDVQLLIDEHIQLPSGYFVSYGGQFENLRSAKARLLIAVPVALLLIFILLHFAFGSVKEALMVYTAIPLSAVGGVFLLWLRDLPFSISAGVGFIALFGIAVLNGIVLIEHFKELKEQGITDIKQRVIQGASERMRAVLLTASAAALGFFPMAFSHGSGAEVQRPLATVVIGGLVTSTLLTLIVLPILYYLYEKSKERRLMKNKTLTASVLLFFMLLPFAGKSQQIITLDQAIEIGMENSSTIKAASLSVDEKQALIGASFDLEKTNVYYQYDENNIGLNGLPIKVWGISQAIRFPSVYIAQRSLAQKELEMQKAQFELVKNRFLEDLTLAYYQLVYLQHKRSILAHLDSLYSNIAQTAKRKYTLGEQNYLEMLNTQARQQEIRMRLKQLDEDINIGQVALNRFLMLDNDFKPADTHLTKLEVYSYSLDLHPEILLLSKQKQNALSLNKLAKANRMPDLSLDYFQGKNNGPAAQLYQGFSVGVSLPLWFGASQSKIKASAIQQKVVDQNYTSIYFQLQARQKSLLGALSRDEQALLYYQSNGKKLADELLKVANKSYQHGEIDFLQFLQSVQSAQLIELDYLDNLNSYNQNTIRLKYLNLN
ncbi:MAG: CusA/CzcA family heavy metal efflux RND transporter [Bacteroidales bacterium]|nr:CusA/CzcA family heavy metal efflux RND transporter [Bacteroidales bacterium]